jgi:2-C-methyl-D-erythritol 2,4-cyclodiphosphate synthase
VENNADRPKNRSTRNIKGVIMKIGIGYDVHKLVKNRKLILGGIEIPFTLGLEGHSDADVLTHAIIDALLGAAGLGNIGQHFSNTDPQYKNISSLKLLDIVKNLLNINGHKIINIDSTVVMQEPKLQPYIKKIQNSLATRLKIDPSLINVKGKTEEGLGFTGTKQGVAAHAICLID